MVNSTDLLANLYNAFNPFEPLPAGDPKYVDCQSGQCAKKFRTQ
ncbi:MAG: hypothetical protein V7K68_26715 [Nostoc sp.]